MKKLLVLLTAALVLFSLVSCSSSESRGGVQNNSKTVDDVLNAAGETTAAETAAPAETSVAPTDSGEYDVDLTKLNSTMVYSEVYNMMIEPDSYVGKKIKMAGTFAVYQGETQNYYACLIKDATACCSQGIEFVLTEERSFPDEYPDLGDEITVTGVFETYEEDSIKYIHLINAELI